MEAEGVVRFFQGEAGDPGQKQKNLLFLRSRPTVPAVAFKILVFVFINLIQSRRIHRDGAFGGEQQDACSERNCSSVVHAYLGDLVPLEK